MGRFRGFRGGGVPLSFLDSSEAGALYADALINDLSLTPGQGVMVAAGGSDFEPAPFGTAAFMDGLPPSGPTVFTSASNAVALDYSEGKLFGVVEMTEDTTATISGIADYSTVLLQIVGDDSTPYDFTWPAGAFISAESGVQEIEAGSKCWALIYRDGRDDTFVVTISGGHKVPV